MDYDITVIRPEMRVSQVTARGETFSPERTAAVREGLRTLHGLEIMAVNIYKCQITTGSCALNTVLTAAMCNEMTHNYSQLLAEIEWDEETRLVVEKDQADENGHLERWKYSLAHPEDIC